MIHFSNITRSGNLQKNHVDLEISLIFVLTSKLRIWPFYGSNFCFTSPYDIGGTILATFYIFGINVLFPVNVYVFKSFLIFILVIIVGSINSPDLQHVHS